MAIRLHSRCHLFSADGVAPFLPRLPANALRSSSFFAQIFVYRISPPSCAIPPFTDVFQFYVFNLIRKLVSSSTPTTLRSSTVWCSVAENLGCETNFSSSSRDESAGGFGVEAAAAVEQRMIRCLRVDTVVIRVHRMHVQVVLRRRL